MNARRGMGGHESPVNGKDEWLTPPYIHNALGGAHWFHLDPCSPVNRPWPTAHTHYTIEDDGLSKPWAGRVWLNPPYGRKSIIGPWMRKMAAHNCGTALIFARVETEVFFEMVWERASAVLFLEWRLCFYNVDGTRAPSNAGAPSCLVAYGAADAEILKSCGLAGQYVLLKHTLRKRGAA